MPLSTQQLQTLKAAILAETDPAFVQWRTDGADGAITDWFNADASPVEKAWRSFVMAQELDELSDYSAFDTIAAGKRDAWAMFLQYAPRDFTRNKTRKLITDVWGASSSSSTTAFAILSGVTRNVTRAEKMLGGDATATTGAGTGAVTAKRLSEFSGLILSVDIYNALKVA